MAIRTDISSARQKGTGTSRRIANADGLARRMARLAPSRVVTDILALAEQPDVISLAGGLPDPAVFPLERVRESMARVLEEEGPEALNYGPNPGYSKLRDWLAERTSTREGIDITRDHVLVTSGGIEALNLASMALLDEGDVVLVEAPTYLAALHVFRAYDARIVPVAVDEGGLSVEALEDSVRKVEKEGTRARFLYVIPSFQNPSGRTWSEERRRRIVAVAADHGIPIVEDHAYAELVYEGEALPSLKSLAPDNVVFIHTFSKIFGPGVRLGWAAASPELITQLGLCKLGTDQCANTLTQRLVYDYGSRGLIESQVASSIELYRRKRDAMERAMKEHFPTDARWIHAEGGFFFWVELPEGADSESLLVEAIESHKTAFVSGPPFFADGSGQRFLRLSFSFVPEAKIEEGIARLGRALADAQPPNASGSDK